MIAKTSDGIVRHHILDPAQVDLYRIHAAALRAGSARAPSAARPLALTALAIIGGLVLAFTILSEPANGQGTDLSDDAVVTRAARIVIVRASDAEISECGPEASNALAPHLRRLIETSGGGGWTASELVTSFAADCALQRVQ